MAYRVVQPTQLRQEPTDTGEPVRALLSKAVLTFLGKKQGDGDDVWINVEFKPPGGSTSVKGWVRLKHCEEIADAPREEVNPEGFVRTCLTAERSFNDLGSTAPWFVSADFVIARAVIETGLTNAGPKASETDAVGPLQVASPEWAMFLDNAGPFAADFEPGGRDHPTLQVYGATYRMHVDMKAISQAKLDKGIGTREDPFLPSNLDIFHAYLTNSPAAAVAILDARDSDADKNKKIDEILKGVLTDEQITALFKARSQFTGEKGNPKSVSEFVAATESALSDALKKAFDLIKELCPEELPAAKQAEAPWFDFAQTQEGIKEPDPRILDYFDATDFKPKPRSTTTPWCGAFASYCMMKSGDATAAASIPGGSAAAVNWKKWGASLTVKPEEVPLGAVVVLSPSPGTGGTGHVGFYAQFLNDGKTVELLGGNQSNQVVRKAFPASRIVAIRWLDLGPPTAAEAAAQVPLPAGEPPPGAPPPVGGHPGGPAPAMAISPAARDLIVEAEVSCKAAYDMRYCRMEWPQGASGVTIGIG